MAEFYPSEIARLVLGYLEEIQCHNSWQTFLEECSDLQEHNRLYKEEKFCTTNVNGKSLLNILAEYCTLKNAGNENNQNKCSANSYQIYGVYKTPSKVNESAYTRFRINQKIQTQSVISSVKSPSGRCNLFRSPTSRPTVRTPRRRLECQVNNLNFGSEAESANEKATSSVNVTRNGLISFISSSGNQTSSNAVFSVDGAGYSDTSVLTSPEIHNGSERTRSSPAASFKNLKSRESEDLSSFSHSKTSKYTSSQFVNASESDDLVCHSSELDSGKQNSSTIITSNSSLTQSSVHSKSTVSSEITASTENITVSESCSTPQYDVDPPPYNRAPHTNSPRLVLSEDRSLIPSLTTPNKDRRCWPEEEWSPKRKGSIPRRRLISESPVSKYFQQPETIITFDSVIENLFGPDEVLFNDPLVQLLTENINKVKQCELKETEFVQDGDLDDIVKKAAEYTEEDPAFERFLSTMCGSSKDCIDSNCIIEYTPSKLADADCEKDVSGTNKTDEANIPDKIVSDDKSSHEITQKFINNYKCDFQQTTIVEKIVKTNSNVLDESPNSTREISQPSAHLNPNHALSSNPQELVASGNDVPQSLICASSITENKTNASDNLSENPNRVEDLTNNMPIIGSSDKDLHCAECSPGMMMEINTSVGTVNKDVGNCTHEFNDDNLVSQEKISARVAETDHQNEAQSFDNLNTSVDSQNTPQTVHHSKVVTVVDNQSGQTISSQDVSSGDSQNAPQIADHSKVVTIVDNQSGQSINSQDASSGGSQNALQIVDHSKVVTIVDNQSGQSINSQDVSGGGSQNAPQIADHSKVVTIVDNQSGQSINSQDVCDGGSQNAPQIANHSKIVTIVDNQSGQTNISQNISDGDSQNTPQIVDHSKVVETVNNQSGQTISSQNISGSNSQNTLQVANEPKVVASTDNQSGPTIIASQLSNQPNALLEVPLPSLPAILMSSLAPDGSIQSNLYRFVINTPISFNTPPVGGMCLPLQTIAAPDVVSPLVVTSPAMPLSNVPNLTNIGTHSGNLKNSVSTPTSSGGIILCPGSSSKKNASLSTKVSTPKKSQKQAKKRKLKDVNCKDPKLKEADQQDLVSSSTSSQKGTKRKCIRKLKPKRKPLCLFPSPSVDSPSKTPNKNADNENPVLSNSCNQSSALKLFSQITGQIERADRSPVLKALMSNAAVLSDQSSRLVSPHVRCLDFSLEPDEKNNEQQGNIKEGLLKSSSADLSKSGVLNRRSSRIQQSKMKDKMFSNTKTLETKNIQQQKKSSTKNVLPSADERKNIESNSLGSSMFSKALDVLSYADDTQIFCDLDVENSDPKVSTSNVSEIASTDIVPSNQDTVALNTNKESEDEEIELIELNDSDEAGSNSEKGFNVLPYSPEKVKIVDVPKDNFLSELGEKQKSAVTKMTEDISKHVSLTIHEKVKKSPTMCKGTIPICTNLDVRSSNKLKDNATDSNNQRGENVPTPIKFNELNSKRLEFLLFGSDSEMTPEKCTDFASGVSFNVFPSPVTPKSINTNVLKSTEAIETPDKGKSRNVSSKILPSTSKKSSVAHSNSDSARQLSQSKKCNLVLEKNESTTSSLSNQDRTKAVISSSNLDQSNEKKENFNKNSAKKCGQKSKIIKITRDLDEHKEKKQFIGDKAHTISDENITTNIKHYTSKHKPERKSLENIVSFCKEKESTKSGPGIKTVRNNKLFVRSNSYNEIFNEKRTHKSPNQQPNVEISFVSENNLKTIHKSKDVKDIYIKDKNINISSQSPENTRDYLIQKHCFARDKKHSKVLHISKQKEDSFSALNNLQSDSKNEMQNINSCKTNSLQPDYLKEQIIAVTLPQSIEQIENAKLLLNSFSTNNNSNCTKMNSSINKDIHLQSENSSSSFPSKVTNKEIDKVLPPPKKRIRPIPVDSSSNESFTPFTQFLPSPSINRPACAVSPENLNKAEQSVKNYSDIHKTTINSETKSKSNETNDVSVSVSTSESSTNFTKNSSLNNEGKSLVSSVISPHLNSVTPVKQSTSILEIKSPVYGSRYKCASPSPTFKHPSLWKSGKPKAMADFYKAAFPDKTGELPISPLSFSNSSCTLDAFSAKRKLLEDSPAKSLVYAPESDALNTRKNVINSKVPICSEQEILEDVEQRETVSHSQKLSINNSCNMLQPLKENSSEILLDDIFDNSKEVQIATKKRKRNDSYCSDSCATVVDFNCEITTPVKSDDWYKRDLFHVSPIIPKRQNLNSSCSESDCSPEKEDCFGKKLDFTSPSKVLQININAEGDKLHTDKVDKFNENACKNASMKISVHRSDTTAVEKFSMVSSDVEVTIHKTVSEIPTEKVKKNTEVLSKQDVSKIKKLPVQKIIENTSPDKKERRSRPTLKIASFKSPCKKKNDKKQNLSFQNSCIEKPALVNTIAEKISPKAAFKTSKSHVKSVKKCIGISSDKNTKLNSTVSGKKASNINEIVNNIATEDMKSTSRNAYKNTALPDSRESDKNIDLCETTQDMVESDIGRSNEEGSELAIAIASCERELLSPRDDHSSQSPRHQTEMEINMQRKNTAENKTERQGSPIKLDTDESKFGLILDKIKLIDPDKLENILNKLMKE